MQTFCFSVVWFACIVRARRLQSSLQQVQDISYERRHRERLPDKSLAKLTANRSSRGISSMRSFKQRDILYKSLAASLLALSRPQLAFHTAAFVPAHLTHGHRDGIAMNMNIQRGQESDPPGSKSAPKIASEGLRNVMKDSTGWFFGAPSNLYSNLPSKEDLQRAQLIQVVETLESDMQRILREDPHWDIFTEDLSVKVGETNQVEGIGACILLLQQVRKICAEFGEISSTQSQFVMENSKLESASMPEFLKGQLRVEFGRAKLPHWDDEISLTAEVTLAFHVNENQRVDYVSIEQLLLNGKEFQVWPEAVVVGLQEDVSNILTREPTWDKFSKDFTVYDRTGITGNWYIPTLETNKGLLALLRQSRSAFAVILKEDLQVKDIRRSFSLTPDGTIQPALIAQWRFAVHGNFDIPILGRSAFDNLPHVEGASIFQLNREGKISSMTISPLSVNGRELRLPELGIPDLRATL